MVFNKQGQQTSVKGFTYKFNTGAGFFQAGVKENANIWVKHYTNKAAFEANDAKFGSTGQVGGAATRTQAPNSASGNVGDGSSGNDFFTAHQIPDGTVTQKLTDDIAGAMFLAGGYDGNYVLAGSDSGFIYRYSKNPLSRFDAISLNQARCDGVTFDGQYYWHGTQGFIYQVDSSGQSINSFSNNGTSRGLAWDGSYIWAGNSSGGVYQFKTDGTEVNSFGPVSKVSGLAFDGVYLIVASTGANSDQEISFRKRSDLSLVSSFSQIGDFRTAPGWDGEYLYLTAHPSETVYQVSNSASLDLSYQVSGFSLGGGVTTTYNANESLNLNENYSDNTGTLTGFIYRDGNKVSNAYVYAVEKSSGANNFKGGDVTGSNGDYKIPPREAAVDSFEDGDITSNPQWNELSTAGGSSSVVSTRAYSGDKSLEITTDGDNDDETYQIQHTFNSSDLKDGDVFQFRIYPTEDGIKKRYTVSGSTGTALINFAADGVLNANTDLETNTDLDNDYATDQWFDCKMTVDKTNGEVDFEVLDINGNTVGTATKSATIDFDTVTITVEDDSFNNLSGSFNVFYDDVTYAPDQQNDYFFGGDEYLVAVDHKYDSSTWYGEEKSIIFDENS